MVTVAQNQVQEPPMSTTATLSALLPETTPSRDAYLAPRQPSAARRREHVATGLQHNRERPCARQAARRVKPPPTRRRYWKPRGPPSSIDRSRSVPSKTVLFLPTQHNPAGRAACKTARPRSAGKWGRGPEGAGVHGSVTAGCWLARVADCIDLSLYGYSTAFTMKITCTKWE